MESFLSRYKNALALIVILLAQVIGLAVQARRPVAGAPDGQGVRLIRYWVTSVIAPPERLLHATGGGIRGIWFGYLDLIHVRAENKQLKADLDRLRIEQAGLAEDAKQGQRLQSLLGFREHYIYKTLPAQVVGASGTEESHLLIIDKGSRDGIQQDMPVITPDGIVGKIREVFPHSSHVLEISDSTSGAGVMLQTTRIRGVLRGSTWGQPQIVNVSPDDRIKPGEAVVTSGGDAIFPRGLAVGTVERSIPDPDGTLVDILIRPAANLSRLEEVLVITSMGNQLPAQTTQDVADSLQQKASDILAERLPSRVDPNAPAEQKDDLAGATADGDVARPIRPPAALHPDAFSPGGTPPADAMTPGARSDRVLTGEGRPVPIPVKRAVPAAGAPSQDETAPRIEGSGSLASDAAASRTDIPKPVEKKPELVHDYSGATPPQYSHPDSQPANPGTPGANPNAAPPQTTAPSHPALPKKTVVVDGPERPAAQQPKKPPAAAKPNPTAPAAEPKNTNPPPQGGN